MKEAQTLACQRQDLTQKLSTLTPGYHDMTLFCDTGNLWNVNIRKSVLPTVIVLLEYRKNHIKSLSLNHCDHCVLTIILNCLISNNTQEMWSCFSCFNSLRLKYFLNIVGVGGCVLWFYSKAALSKLISDVREPETILLWSSVSIMSVIQKCQAVPTAVWPLPSAPCWISSDWSQARILLGVFHLLLWPEEVQTEGEKGCKLPPFLHLHSPWRCSTSVSPPLPFTLLPPLLCL